jgi:PAS domain S-box-containing protein
MVALLAWLVACNGDVSVEPDATAGPSQSRIILAFVRRFRDEILTEWRQGARELPVARNLSMTSLVDHIPEVLDEIGSIAEELVAQRSPSVPTAARSHALERLAEGFDIGTVVSELSMLRGAALSVWGRAGMNDHARELRALDLAIDCAIAASVSRYAEAHVRTLAGIDRISTASFESATVEELLQRLLAVFIETTPAVDSAAIFLHQGDRLHLRASVGLEEHAIPTSLAVGEDFCGRVAEASRPLEVRGDRVGSSAVGHHDGRGARYGVPLVHEGRVIGVAEMGSRAATEFSQEDRQFFGSMAARATVGIVHHVLQQELARSREEFRQLADQHERALAKLEALLAASPVGIAFVDRDLRYLRINDALAALDGSPARDHIGRSVNEILPEAAPRLEPMLRGVLDTGVPVLNIELETETHALLANYFPVRSASGEITGVGAIMIDMTDARRAQRALRTEQLRIQSILEHTPSAIWIKDREGRVVLANHRLADALGTRFEDVIGRRSHELVPDEFATQHEAHDAIVLDEQRAIEVEEVVPSPGGPRTFLSVKFPIPGDPPLVGAIATEITERKRMEEELRIAVRTREEVLAVVSHDLRTPLQAIQLAVTMLTQAENAPRVRRYAEPIERACARMEKLIEDLLDTANIRAGRLRLDLRSESASAVAAEAFDVHKLIAEQRGLSLACELDTAGIEIRCDRERLLRVFANLIGNAIKFCRPGDSITITSRQLDAAVVFAVADTGPGIRPEALRGLFDPYVSAPEHVARGTGLGLYIARGIVEAHGGRIWVDSTPGTGTTFSFRVPAANT